MPFVAVAVARPVGGPFTYSVPAMLSAEIRVGHVVLVPFGRRGSETGYVVELLDEPGFDPAKIKSITRLLDPLPAFNHDQLSFFRWMADYYLNSLGLVIQTAVPSQIRARVFSVIEPTDEGVEAIALDQTDLESAQVLREIIGRPGLTRRGLARRLADEFSTDEVERLIKRLCRKEWAVYVDREVKETRSVVQLVRLVVPYEGALERLPRAGSRQRALLLSLSEAPDQVVDLRALLAAQGASARSSLKRLESAGVVCFEEREASVPLLDSPAMGAVEAPQLNDDQCRALEVLCAAPAGQTHLLFGVTGSGKTEVFLGAAKATLEREQQVLVLVPEIGLTPQLVGRFKARFGDEVAVLHSGLTGAERLAEWRRIRRGEADIVVGARSALFAPFGALGLIVVDEEHDDSYKQDDGVRYNARDLAVVLGKKKGAVVVLASATPSLESWYNAKNGRYVLLRLPKRATPRPVPVVQVVDMRELTPGEDGERPMLAPKVVDALRRTFERGGQAIVLYNRRGYATIVECRSCGGVWDCPNCGIALTYHRGARVLACHYCGLKRPAVKTCPACHSETLREGGKGTERVEEVLSALFPNVKTARMDADSTAVRGSLHQILDAFRSQQIQLLIGTQIVAKGHDFPNVRTAVVVSADHGLRMPDFRASERTYSLLVQVCGRAGRGDNAGEVFVQTWNPEHEVIQSLDDVESFYASELRLRELLSYPPFTRLCLIGLEGVDRRAVQERAHVIGRALNQNSRAFRGVQVLGPTQAAMARRVGRWRWQIVLRGHDIGAFRAYLSEQLVVLKKAKIKGIRVSWDVDPRHLL